MAIPQLRSEGDDQGGTTASFTVSFANFVWAAGDIIEIAVATDGYVPTLSTANGFVLAQDPVGNSASVTTNAGTAGTVDCGMFVFWKRAVGSTTTTDPPPVFAAATGGGTCWCLEPNAYSGARASGTPYHLIATAILGTASATVAPPSVTPTLANCLVMTRVAGSNDDQAFNSWTMTGSSGPAAGAPASGWHNGSGNACSFIGADGGYATAGGARSGTSTFGASTKQAQISLVMASVAEVAAATGNEAATLAASIASEAGNVAVSGAVARALGASIASSLGSVAIAGNASATLDSSTASSSGSTITRTGNEAGILAASIATSSGTVSSGPVGLEAGQLAPSLGVASGTVAVSAAEAASAAASAGAAAGTVSLTGQHAATNGASSAAITGNVTTPVVLAMGKVAIRQKANTTSPNSGTLTTFPVYPAWQASHAYLLQDGVRITNAGNIYELQSDGTSASSGGPSTTAAGITDGSAHWNYLGPGTGAMDTQAAGSFLVASCAWGKDSTGGAIPSDNKGNTWSQLAKNFYTGFPTSSNALYAASQPATGGTGHTLTGAFGLGTNFGGDEFTEILAEVIGGTHIQDRSYVERASATANVVTSAAVVTTGPAILIAFWWLNGVVRAGGTNHDAAPGSGFAEIPEGRALMEIGPSGAGEVQVTTHFRSVSAPGTYTASITTTSGEGSAVYLVAIQGVAGITGNEAALSGASIASSSGTVTTPRTGNEAAQLGVSSGNSAGGVSVTGGGGARGGASSGAASGSVATTGSVAAQLGGSIASSSGTLVPAITGTEAAALGASTSASFGTVFSGIGGQEGAALAASIAAATGRVLVLGAASLGNDASVPTIAATVLVLGTQASASSESIASSRGTVGAAAGAFRRLVGSLASANQMIGLLQLEGVTLTDLTGPILIYQGDTADFLITVVDDAGAPVDLSFAAVELQIKTQVGDPDPPLVAKSLGLGIELLDQAQTATRGKATCSLSSVETSMAARLYSLDVVVVLAGRRAHVIPPRDLIIGAVVNGP